ncbi:MAG: Rpn family recombination-promoting nuclease/putative transposase [Schlesneria sp.]
MASHVIGIIATVDFAFKLMLGSPEHTKITIHFLNAILGESTRITHVTILKPILGKDFDDDKLSVLDILAEDEHGRKFNIEMQTSVLPELPQRLTYYLSAVYSSQLTEGVGYSSLHQAISICVLTKSMFPNDPRLHFDFRLRDSSGLILTNDLQIHLLELPKLSLTQENVFHATPIERWAYFLRNADRLSRDDVTRLFPDPEIAEAAGVLEMISKSPEERRLYDMRLKFQRDEATRIESEQRTKREFESARAELDAATRELETAQRKLEAAQRDTEAAQRETEAARAELEAARTKALREGEGKGEKRGVLLGRIGLLRELLGDSQPAISEIAAFGDEQLAELVEQLQSQLRNRSSSN